jgi:hypothetical protein
VFNTVVLDVMFNVMLVVMVVMMVVMVVRIMLMMMMMMAMAFCYINNKKIKSRSVFISLLCWKQY